MTTMLKGLTAAAAVALVAAPAAAQEDEVT